jgi:non-ribosomal peptide synthetase component F
MTPASVPLGRPIDNTRIYVLDDRLEPVADGEPGELFVAGDGLAQGYWDRAELTAERFLANPFAGDRYARLYRTGDRTRVLPDGNLELSDVSIAR